MKVAWDVLALEAAQPFRITRSTERSLRRVRVRIRAGGAEGWGEADPSAYYGEDADSVVSALERVRPVLEAADDPESLERIEGELAGVLGAAPGGRRGGPASGREVGGSGTPARGRGTRGAEADDGSGDGEGGGDRGGGGPDPRRNPHASARAAVSAALHDLQGKLLGRPLWRLWGLDPGEAPVSSFTLGMDDPDVMARKARAARGWPILKVKLGAEREREEAMLEAVRSGAPDAALRVDVNAGWTAEEALERIPGLAERGVELVEQPLPPSDREGLRRVREASTLPIVLDESCVVAADVPGLVGLADGINVKLAKCGGPREALRAIHTARACGLEVMLGCMLETSLGIAPAAHLSPLVDWTDLDGAHLLARDPFRGPGPVAPSAAGAGVGPGRITLGDEPGLGVARR